MQFGKYKKAGAEQFSGYSNPTIDKEPEICDNKKANLKINFKLAFLLAGLGGFEPPKCQSQSLVPYHLATAQYIYFMG